MSDRTDAIVTALFFASFAMMVAAGVVSTIGQGFGPIGPEFGVFLALCSIYTALAALFLMVYSDVRS